MQRLLVASDEHFLKCLVYIDLNMVRAGAVKQLLFWKHGGFLEIQQPPKRYRLINISSLMSLVNIKSLDVF